jgi:two-component system response regulator FixJ
MTNDLATIHVVDDDEAARESLVFLLTAADFPVQGYASAQAFLQAGLDLGTGCLITDVRMPDIDGIELLRRLRQRSGAMPVIVITGHGDLPLAVEAIKLGAVDFIEKPFDSEVLLAAVRLALAVGSSPQEQDDKCAAIRERLNGLTARERQVLDGLVVGNPNKVIAGDLSISPRNVEVLRASIMTKMDVRGLSGLVRMVLLANHESDT